MSQLHKKVSLYLKTKGLFSQWKRESSFRAAVKLLGWPQETSRAEAKKILEGLVAQEGISIKKKRQRRTSPESDGFLLSYEWRKVRMQVLKRDGARCVCCGATPADGVRVNVDHIKPRKTHPELALDLNNLQVLCAACNHGKGNWDQTDWRPKGVVIELEEWQKRHLKEIV